MKVTEFSGYITGNPVRYNCTKDGKTHFINFSIAFYGGKKDGVEYSEYLDISLVTDDESRVNPLLEILQKGSFVTGRGKLFASIYHKTEGNKKTSEVKEQVKCRVEAIQIVSRKPTEPTDEDCLPRAIEWLNDAICRGVSLIDCLCDLICIKHGVESIDAIEQPDEQTANILANIDKIGQGHGVNG